MKKRWVLAQQQAKMRKCECFVLKMKVSYVKMEGGCLLLCLVNYMSVFGICNLGGEKLTQFVDSFPD